MAYLREIAEFSETRNEISDRIVTLLKQKSEGYAIRGFLYDVMAILLNRCGEDEEIKAFIEGKTSRNSIALETIGEILDKAEEIEGIDKWIEHYKSKDSAKTATM